MHRAAAGDMNASGKVALDTFMAICCTFLACRCLTQPSSICLPSCLICPDVDMSTQGNTDPGNLKMDTAGSAGLTTIPHQQSLQPWTLLWFCSLTLHFSASAADNTFVIWHQVHNNKVLSSSDRCSANNVVVVPVLLVECAPWSSELEQTWP